MEYEDLEFSVIGNNNEEVICKILSLIPKNDDEIYIVFTDDEKDENDNIIFKYGILENIDDEYELKSGVASEELEYIKDMFYEDVLELAKSLNNN